MMKMTPSPPPPIPFLSLSLSLFLSFHRYQQLLKEKEELEEAFLTFRQEIRHSEKADVSKEMRVLKAVIGNLEVKGMTEHH